MVFYRAVLAAASPFLTLWLLWRRWTGRDSARGAAERRGCGEAEAEAPVLWLHGASNGELTSARWLIAELLARAPGLRLIVTCNTETGRDMVESWGMARVFAALAPMDFGAALDRFFDRWRPGALVILENELWPRRIAIAGERGVPVLVLGARLSEGSARTWARVPGLARAVMAGIAYLSAQDAGSEARFQTLGLPANRIGPVVNLKARQGPEQAPLPDDLVRAFDRGRTFLAASTHAGEEAELIAGFRQAQAAGHIDRMILAPRHPRRRAEIAALLQTADLPFATRSMGEAPGTPPVYLADTMGEMALWYRLAGLTFVGGSLVDVGGHTPFEPAAHGSALIHGPHVSNFEQAYAALDAGGGAIRVMDAKGIAGALATLAAPAKREAMAARASALLLSLDAGGEAALFSAIGRALDLPALEG